MPHDDANRDHFDLLPFIAILLCMLGCLLLVTMSVAALSLGPGAGEGWIIKENAVKHPVLVEWDGSQLIVHRDENGSMQTISWPARTPVKRGDDTVYIPDENQKRDPALDRLLDEFQGTRSDRYVLFAVRPSGFDQFDWMASEFRSRQIDIGYEPLGQSKPVKLLPQTPPAPAAKPSATP